MVEIVRKIEHREFSHILKIDDKYYYVDSIELYDNTFETMVFKCDEYGEVSDWFSIYTMHYLSREDMADGHDFILKHLDRILLSYEGDI